MCDGGLTGVLREQSAALAVDYLLDDWHVGRDGRGRDQADARHHGVYGCDEAQPGVEPLDTQRVCRTEQYTKASVIEVHQYSPPQRSSS